MSPPDITKPNFLELLTAPDLDGAHPGRVPLEVRSFHVTEAVSSLFQVRIIATHSSAALDFDEIVGDVGHFFVAAHATREEAMSLDTTRVWSGIVNHFELVRGVRDGEGLSTYEITLVPTLWLLTQRRNHRMFQYKTAVDIAEILLKEWNIDHEIRLDRRQYKARKYKVQYAETDYEFFARVLAEVGISFFFERIEGDTRLVIADAPERQKPLPDALDFEDSPNAGVGKSWVTQVRKTKQVRPAKVVYRDRDYRKDSRYELQAQAAVEKDSKLELFYYPENFNFVISNNDAQTPSADDRGVARADEREAARIAQIDLEARRGDAYTLQLESNDPRVAVGAVIRIDNHPAPDVNDKAGFLVVEARFSGRVDAPLRIAAALVSTKKPYRPAPAPKPRIIGLESATVVGPAGEEIHCDEFGRVRVHFHWDRESHRNEASSCWIPVSQTWGGSGYGGVQLPRVGQEVLVEFLAGDPDRPIITGRVFTNTQKVPYKLPGNKTQSGLRSNSTGGTGGYNELMFEDKSGQELLRMQAERDKQELVKRNSARTVGGNCGSTVQGRRSTTVNKSESKRVNQSQSNSIGDTQCTSVKNKISVECEAGPISFCTAASFDVLASVSTHSAQNMAVFTVGGSIIVMTPSTIVIEGPKVYINPGEAFVKEMLATGRTPEENAQFQRQMEAMERDNKRAEDMKKEAADLEKRSQDLNERYKRGEFLTQAYQDDEKKLRADQKAFDDKYKSSSVFVPPYTSPINAPLLGRENPLGLQKAPTAPTIRKPDLLNPEPFNIENPVPKPAVPSVPQAPTVPKPSIPSLLNPEPFNINEPPSLLPKTPK